MSRRETACGLLAVAAVVIYMLACGSRPAWSPDSKRVVFAYLDQETKTSGLALYDLPTGQVKRIFETEEQVLFQPVWLGKKEQVVALGMKGQKDLDVIQVDLETGKDKLVKRISSEGAGTAIIIPPILTDERYLLFSFALEGDNYGLHRLDLETGELSTVPQGPNRYLFKIGRKCFYLGESEGGWELGSLDTRGLKFRRLVTMDAETHGLVRLGLAGKRDGSEFAIVVVRQGEKRGQGMGDEDKLVILIINRRGKIIKEIALPTDVDAESTQLVYMVYGPKDKKLWVPVVKTVPTEEKGEERAERILSLLEVDLKKGTHRTVIEAPVDDEEYFMQPNISPDGKWLAVDVLLPKDEPRSVLYLVDLTNAQRKVTKVALPEVELLAEPSEREETE